jgi:hypothetical protein
MLAIWVPKYEKEYASAALVKEKDIYNFRRLINLHYIWKIGYVKFHFRPKRNRKENVAVEHDKMWLCSVYKLANIYRY